MNIRKELSKDIDSVLNLLCKINKDLPSCDAGILHDYILTVGVLLKGKPTKETLDEYKAFRSFIHSDDLPHLKEFRAKNSADILEIICHIKDKHPKAVITKRVRQ